MPTTVVFLSLVLCLGSVAQALPEVQGPEIGRVGHVAGILDVVQHDGKTIVRATTGDYQLVAIPDARIALAPTPTAAESTPVPADLLPGSTLTSGIRDIRAAWLADPTDRYSHGVLGDALEASSLKVEAASGQILSYDLSPYSVFEDLTARIVDIDGDGRDEVIVVHSYLERGAALAVFGIRGDRLERLAESAPIGMSNRWMNPLGTGDFDGDGRIEIAVVRTPHIGGVLVLYRRDGNRLVEVARKAGFSTHAAGSTALHMGVVLDLDDDSVPEILLPGPHRRELVAVGLVNGNFVRRWSVAHDQPIVTSLVAGDLDGNGRDDVAYGLADGSVMVLRR